MNRYCFTYLKNKKKKYDKYQIQNKVLLAILLRNKKFSWGFDFSSFRKTQSPLSGKQSRMLFHFMRQRIFMRLQKTLERVSQSLLGKILQMFSFLQCDRIYKWLISVCYLSFFLLNYHFLLPFRECRVCLGVWCLFDGN